ncbi:hypothetical protein, partial [Devosia elaeis]|uniref:hypothetical protein n=1 Tax=Devosia elaeis TaxID=1770058 RepID=UPI00104214B4
MMTKSPPKAEDIATVEAALWNTVRVLEAIEREAVSIAMKTDGEVNAMAEGISGMAADLSPKSPPVLWRV